MELPPLELDDLEIIGADEDPYIGCLVTLGNCVRLHLVIAASLIPLRPLPWRDEAVLMGSMTRIHKLYDSIVFLISKDRLEIASVLLRPLMDTVLNLLFLIEHGTDSDYAKFVKSSLAYDKRFLENIQQRRQREGRLDQEWEIERRMRESVEARFAQAGYSLDDIEWKDRQLFGDTSAKARKLNLEELYEIGFRTGSYSIHGTWQDLYLYQFDDEDGVLHPHLHYHQARPQILELATTLALYAARQYVLHVYADEAESFVSRLQEIHDWQEAAQQKHAEATGDFSVLGEP